MQVPFSAEAEASSCGCGSIFMEASPCFSMLLAASAQVGGGSSRKRSCRREMLAAGKMWGG